MDLLCQRNGWIAISLIFVALTILAIYNTSEIASHRLPISTAGSVLSLLLPALQSGGSLWLGFSARIRTTTAINLAWALSILDGALISLAAFQTTEQTLGCMLESSWRHWFENKDRNPIRRVQNAFQCCGFRSAVDKAWPFPDASHGVNACTETFNRTDSCFAPWSHAVRKALVIILVIGALSLTIKISIGVLLQIRLSRADMHIFRRPRDREQQALLGAREEGGAETRRYTDDSPRGSTDAPAQQTSGT